VGGAERAASLLQQQYGEQAAAQVAQLQQQNQSVVAPAAFAGTQRQQTPYELQLQQQQQRQQQLEYQRRIQQDYQQRQQQSQQPHIKQEFKEEAKEEFKPEDSTYGYPQSYNVNTIKNSQVDGPADARDEYEAEIAHRRALVAQHRPASDRLIRDQVLASQQTLEAGGLMMPLGSQRSSRSRRTVAQRQAASSSLSRAQGDAPGDEEEDEDAINSDLDDPDELDGANEGDDDVTNVMLCTYDKVQRVKNKWKCTLKDGVLKVDGAE